MIKYTLVDGKKRPYSREFPSNAKDPVNMVRSHDVDLFHSKSQAEFVLAHLKYPMLYSWNGMKPVVLYVAKVTVNIGAPIKKKK